MSEISVAIEQIFLLLMVGLIGFTAGRFKYLPASSDKAISALVVKITAPLMIVTKIYNMEFGHEDYLNGVKLYFFAIIFVLTGYSISIILKKICKIEDSTGKIFSLQMMFGNVLYLALPLINILSSHLPEIWGKGEAYAMFFALGNDTILWTLGISLLSNKKKESLKSQVRHFANGNSIAFLIGLVLLITGAKSVLSEIHIAVIVIDKLTAIGNMTAYLSIMFIGLMLSKINIVSIVRNFKSKYPLFISSAVKLLALPLLAVLVVKLLNGFLPLEPAKTLILQLAMPGATLVAALAAQYNCEPEFSTEGIFLSTILLVFTLPVVLWISDLVL